MGYRSSKERQMLTLLTFLPLDGSTGRQEFSLWVLNCSVARTRLSRG